MTAGSVIGAGPKMALGWSGGKDSALALWVLRRRRGAVTRLLTTVTEDFDRVSMHGVRRSLLVRQAAAAGVPLTVVSIPQRCADDVYEARMAQALASAAVRDVEEVAFGDLFLADIRAYRERQLARARFPLWHRDTRALARHFIAAGFGAIVVCVDPARLDASFAGRRYDASFLADLPDDVDPCGERGEFHTFAHAGPIFTAPVPCRTGDVIESGGFVFCDLVAT